MVSQILLNIKLTDQQPQITLEFFNKRKVENLENLQGISKEELDIYSDQELLQ